MAPFTELSPTKHFAFSKRSKQQATVEETWPDRYINRDSGKEYKPHGEEEREFVYTDFPRRFLVKGGEGSGKSVAGIIKDLERLRRGMDGVMGSPDLPHFKRSLWPEFKRWCPWECVVNSQQRRGSEEWEPQGPFVLTFKNGAKLFCGGFEDPNSWEGPNLSFAHIDEARRKKEPQILKVLDGRVRIVGNGGELPQVYLTTTPAKHWLFDYFGPVVENDPLAAFKADAKTITLRTQDNETAGNLAVGYTAMRGQSLTESERRVLLGAEWEDVDDVDRFLSSMIWWDACEEELESLDPHTPLIAAADGAYAANGDVFGFVAVGKHPTKENCLAVRHVQAWEAKANEKRDFDEIEREIEKFCKSFNVLELTYDPYQLHQMMSRLENRRIVKTREFNQGKDRLIADKQLLDLIQERRIAHSGFPTLRRHIDNADKKKTEDRKIRIVKRSESLKIDLAVCLSMASAVAVEMLLTEQGWSDFA